MEILWHSLITIACFASKFKIFIRLSFVYGLTMGSNQCSLVYNNDRPLKVLIKSLSNCERPKFLLTSNYPKRYVSELGHVAVTLNSS